MSHLLRRRLPLAAFLALTLLGWAGAVALWLAAGRTEELRFAAVAEEAAGRIRERIYLHLLVIDATAAIIEAQGDTLSAARFAIYFDKLRLAARNPGIAGLGFAPLVGPGEVAALERRLAANYGPGIELRPPPGADPVVPVAIIGTLDPEPPPALGYDMYSEPVRRAALEAAIAARAPRATEPLRLATDTQAAPGFIVYAPVYAPAFGIPARPDAGTPTGFAFGGFRIGELVGAALGGFPRLPVALEVSDADAPQTVLAAFGGPAQSGFGRPALQVRSVEIAGQTWRLAVRPTAAFPAAAGRRLAFGFGAVSTLLAIAGALALNEQAKARAAAEALAAASQRNIAEQDLLLQEMKHRIKNAIARILAIARQTAAQSPDLAAFSASFASRLQAMAQAQDMVLRSAAARADLRALLSRELVQVLGEAIDPDRLVGPPVELDAVRTQALGLVFHELATNALKYGGGCGRAPAIDVEWSVAGPASQRRLDLVWSESGGRVAAPDRFGFGTRLIDTTLRHELGGRVERDWRPEGLRLTLSTPLGAA